MNPSVSVLIVNYNTRDRVLECLESLLAPGTADMDVVVVDNGSTDGSAAAIAARFPDVTVDEAGENLGFAAGVNRAARSSAADFLLLLNPDTTVQNDTVDVLRDFAVAHPQHGLYGGRTFRATGELDRSSCWGAPSLWSLFCFATLASTAFSTSTFFNPESLGQWPRDTVRVVPIITGCLLLVRRGDFDRMGGMDELYFLYGEDAEFSLRAADHGFSPVVVPAASIVHDVGASTGSHGLKMCMVMAGKVTLVRQRWSRGRAALGVGLLLCGTGVRALLGRLTRSEPSWGVVWRRREDWRDGYPTAERTLFGR